MLCDLVFGGGVLLAAREGCGGTGVPGVSWVKAWRVWRHAKTCFGLPEPHDITQASQALRRSCS
jgi:hypothetical protein